MSVPALAQRTVAPPQPAQRGRAAVQQPLRDAAKTKADKQAEKQAGQLPRNPAVDPAKRTEQQRNQTALAVVARYVGGFQKNVGLTDEQTQKLSPLLGNFVRRQLMLAQNRTDAIKRLNELTDQQAPQEEIQAQSRLVDTTETQQNNTRRKFFNDINPELSIQQQAKLRIYLENTGQDLHQAIQKSTQ